MTRVTVILLLLGLVIGLAFALAHRSAPSRDSLDPSRESASPAVSRGVGTSTLSHGGPTPSGAAAGARPGMADLEDRQGAASGGGRRGP